MEPKNEKEVELKPQRIKRASDKPWKEEEDENAVSSGEDCYSEMESLRRRPVTLRISPFFKIGSSEEG